MREQSTHRYRSLIALCALNGKKYDKGRDFDLYVTQKELQALWLIFRKLFVEEETQYRDSET